jgi:hypothetical protein|nr:MAG TPA: ASCH domain protein [Caudoviricetes sp.]
MKQILFNTAMVQAILEGRKTTTRRIIKNVGNRELLEHDGEYYKFGYSSKAVVGTIYEAIHWCKPKFNVGDILYVRETWCDRWLPDGFLEGSERYGYKADGEPAYGLWGNDSQCKLEVWIPSIHMPKEAARLFLKITKIYPEKLRMIEVGECKREGIKLNFEITDSFTASEYISAFEELWDSTVNKKDIDQYGFNANPWVWVIEFEKLPTERINMYKEIFKCDTETAIEKYLKAKNTKVCLESEVEQ